MLNNKEWMKIYIDNKDDIRWIEIYETYIWNAGKKLNKRNILAVVYAT